MRKIKMVALDLDGTLFNEKKQVSQKNQRAIIKAIEKGVVVLPATGRPLIGLPKQITDIKAIQYAVTSNGAAIYDLKAKKPIYTKCIPNAQAAQIIEVIRQGGGLAEVYVDGVCYTDEERYYDALEYDLPEHLLAYIKATRIPVKNLPQFIENSGEDIQKIHVLFDRRNPEDRAMAFEKVKQFEHLMVTSSLDYNMEINAENVHKGNSLVELGKLLGIEKEEIMAMGDERNDLQMLETVGFSVAMGNAVPEVKAIADYITLSNDDDGVAYAIEKFILNAE